MSIQIGDNTYHGVWIRDKSIYRGTLGRLLSWHYIMTLPGKTLCGRIVDRDGAEIVLSSAAQPPSDQGRVCEVCRSEGGSV